MTVITDVVTWDEACNFTFTPVEELSPQTLFAIEQLWVRRTEWGESMTVGMKDKLNALTSLAQMLGMYPPDAQ